MFYPYQQAEQAAPAEPVPPEDSFPTTAAVIALWLWWITSTGKACDAPDAEPNARETIDRISRSKVIAELYQKYLKALKRGDEPYRPGSKKTHADVAMECIAEAWASYGKNIKNTTLGTCATAIAAWELAKMGDNALIKWLPSTAREQDLKHKIQYWRIMTASAARELEICTRYGCQCGFIRV